MRDCVCVLRRGFSLSELLVVIAIIGILMAILLPTLEKATENSRLTVCAENLHSIAVAFAAYGNENNSALPLGPGTASTLSPARPWNTVGGHNAYLTPPSVGAAQANGMGVLVIGEFLKDAKALACPSDDEAGLKDKLNVAFSAVPVGADIYTSYAYRQMDQNTSDRMNTQGVNGKGNPAKALVLDWQSKGGAAPYVHTSHDVNERLNVLYVDGHVQGFDGDSGKWSAGPGAYASFPTSYLTFLDQLWVTADFAETGNPKLAPQLP